MQSPYWGPLMMMRFAQVNSGLLGRPQSRAISRRLSPALSIASRSDPLSQAPRVSLPPAPPPMPPAPAEPPEPPGRIPVMGRSPPPPATAGAVEGSEHPTTKMPTKRTHLTDAKMTAATAVVNMSGSGPGQRFMIFATAYRMTSVAPPPMRNRRASLQARATQSSSR